MIMQKILRSLFTKERWRRVTSKVVSFQKDEKYFYYKTVRWILLVARLSGILPIYGLLNQTSELTGFTFRSPYTLVLLSVWCSVFANLMKTLYHNFNTTVKAGTATSKIIYALATCVSLTNWLQFSRSWKKRIGKIESLEKTLLSLKKPKALFRAVNSLTLYIIIFGVIEHVLYASYLKQKELSNCHPTHNSNSISVKQNDTQTDSDYSKYLSFISTLSNELSKLQNAVAYVLTDVLMISVSIYLVHRFHDYNDLIARKQREIRKNITSTVTWLELQQHYTNLTQLVQNVDDQVKRYVLMTFSMNLTRIGQQLFYILRKQFVDTPDICDDTENLLAVVYLAFSLTFAISRTILVCLTAAHIHSLSRKPLDLLHSLPSRTYNYDVQRFMDQVFHSKVCLSGLGFFHVTRGMILTMVATLVTHELMLIQYVEDSQTRTH